MVYWLLLPPKWLANQGNLSLLQRARIGRHKIWQEKARDLVVDSADDIGFHLQVDFRWSCNLVWRVFHVLCCATHRGVGVLAPICDVIDCFQSIFEKESSCFCEDKKLDWYPKRCLHFALLHRCDLCLEQQSNIQTYSLVFFCRRSPTLPSWHIDYRL